MLYSESELKKRLKAGCPVFYFYAGDEALVRSAAAKVEKALSADDPETTTLNGPTPSVEEIVLAAWNHLLFWRQAACADAARAPFRPIQIKISKNSATRWPIPKTLYLC